MSLSIRYLSVLSVGLALCLGLVIPARESEAEKKTKSKCESSLTQGMRGRIVVFRGNQMPSPDGVPKVGTGVQKRFAIFELTNEKQVIASDKPGFYRKINSKKVASGCSGKDGCLAVKLKPGTYSMFVRENGLWYANGFEGDGSIWPVEVKQNEVTQIEFRISHQAAF